MAAFRHEGGLTLSKGITKEFLKQFWKPMGRLAGFAALGMNVGHKRLWNWIAAAAWK
jgi:hypothetical protein